LRFSPTAWAKLLFLRDRGSTEVGGFGIAPAGDLLCIEDIRLVRQTCSVVSVAFDDTAVAEFFDEQVDAGRRPEQFGRIWIHTHPGASAHPSCVDEETFRRVFGACDWAVMFILARGGETYCRLRFSVGPGGSLEIPVELEFQRDFQQSDFVTWSKEYASLVKPTTLDTWSVEPRDRRFGDEGLAVSSQEAFDDLFQFIEQRKESIRNERPL
jgi:hypothetical protein